MEIVEEIRKLAKFVELDRKIEEKRKAEAEFTEWLRENRVPRRTEEHLKIIKEYLLRELIHSTR